jgi:hypothetical protein
VSRSFESSRMKRPSKKHEYDGERWTSPNPFPCPRYRCQRSVKTIFVACSIGLIAIAKGVPLAARTDAGSVIFVRFQPEL